MCCVPSVSAFCLVGFGHGVPISRPTQWQLGTRGCRYCMVLIQKNAMQTLTVPFNDILSPWPRAPKWSVSFRCGFLCKVWLAHPSHVPYLTLLQYITTLQLFMSSASKRTCSVISIREVPGSNTGTQNYNNSLFIILRLAEETLRQAMIFPRHSPSSSAVQC